MKLFFYFLLSLFVFGATNSSVTQIQSTYNQDTTMDIFINLNNTPNPTINAISGATIPCNETGSNCYTGAIFSNYNTLTINNNSKLTVNLSAIGNYGGWAAVFFRGDGGNTYTINGGTFELNLNSLPDPNSDSPAEGVFMTRRKNSALEVKFVFNSNIIVKATKDFYITRGIFNVNDGSGSYAFNGNTFIDVSEMQASKGWQGSGIGYRSITSLGGDGKFYINYNPETQKTFNTNNIVQLKGDIAVELTSTQKSEAIIHLTNPQSFFQGRFSLQGEANAELMLDNGGKWILTANSSVRTLEVLNNFAYIADPYHHLNKISVVDFTKIADDGVSSRLNFADAFQARTLTVSRQINGENGVFRLMADIPSAKIDSINVTGTLNGNQYLQIYQNSSRVSFNLAGTRLKVAHAAFINGDFLGMDTTAGLYNYTPILTKEVSQDGGIDWYLTDIKHTANQTSLSLFNILSTPYRVFRISADNINHRIDDFLYPPTKFGVWAKVYGGGIYQKNDFDSKKTSQNLFYSFQGGFDYGNSNDITRYFYGGSFDFIKLYGGDSGYDGYTNSYGFGFYGGYIYNDDLFLDAKIKYILSSFSNSFYQNNQQADFYGHILMGDFRVGYNFYFFRKPKNKVSESCKKGSDGKLFCRNTKITAYERDKTFYIQPYFSLTPGVIFGHRLNLIDDISSYHISGNLDNTFALITKIGIQGVKRYVYDNFSVSARTFISYSYDLNLGGKITLNDDANFPLYSNSDQGSHRISLGLGTDVYFFNDSLRLYADFGTEFLSRLNTYWILSAGVRYKFGQPILNYRYSPSYRPKSPNRKPSLRETLRPYQTIEDPRSKTFNRQNHFQESNRGYIRQ